MVDRYDDLLESNTRVVESTKELVKSSEQLVKSNQELKGRVQKLETTQSSMLSGQSGSWRAAVLASSASSPGMTSLPTTISPNSSASHPKGKDALPCVNIPQQTFGADELSRSYLKESLPQSYTSDVFT
jgi:hypothetical protein